MALLLIVTDRFACHAIGFFAFGKRGVVQLLAAIQSPEEFFFLLFIRRESEFIRFPHQFFCPSTERFSVSRAMPPIVATKYEFVHKESKRRCNCGNSCRRYLVQHTT